MQVMGVVSRSAALKTIGSPSAVESAATHTTKAGRNVIVRWRWAEPGIVLQTVTMRLGEHFQTSSHWTQQLRRSVAGKTADLWFVKNILKFRNITPEPAQDAVLGEYDSAITSTTKLGPPILPTYIPHTKHILPPTSALPSQRAR